MTSERRVAVSEALANFRNSLAETDYGECEKCGWAIYSATTPKGSPNKLIVRDCKGFDNSGNHIEGTSCLLVEHLRFTGEIKSD